jgi:NAD(P)-dependent dehydrogenase (short-subunit alcohol dehydrogenase family)
MRSPEKETALAALPGVLVTRLDVTDKPSIEAAVKAAIGRFGSIVAVEGLTESLQYELNPFGIRLKIIDPGAYKTEFVGRSMGWYGAGSLDGYQQPYDRFVANLPNWNMSENIGEVAEAIYAAATDGTDKLRYPVGHDAVPLLEARKEMDDVAFKKMVAGQTGL